MGGNLLANYIGNQGDKCFLTGAFFLSAPMILGEVFNHIVTYKDGFYDKIFLNSIRSFFLDNKDILYDSFKQKLNLDFDAFFD